MNRFIIVDGLPYLYADGKAYSCRFDENGFTVGAEVELASAPETIMNELSIKAQCAGNLDSIGAGKTKAKPKAAESVDEMSIADLKEVAKGKGIKLGSARTKEAIIEAINLAE